MLPNNQLIKKKKHVTTVDRQTFHRLENLRLTNTEMQAQSLSAAKIDQLDDAVGHEHDISTLNVPERKSY